MLGRLIESSILQRLLADRCGRTRYLLCPYRSELRPSLEFFMFDPDSPIQKVGGLRMPKAESMQMVRDAVRYYPAAVVESSLLNSARQFTTFNIGDGLRRYEEADEPAPQRAYVTPVIRSMLPAQYPQYVASRQQQKTLGLGPVRLVDFAIAWAAIVASAAVILTAVRAWRREDFELVLPATDLHVFVWLAAAVNAVVCASFTTVTDRFQARVVWLFVFVCLVTLAQLQRTSSGRRTVTSSGTADG